MHLRSALWCLVAVLMLGAFAADGATGPPHHGDGLGRYRLHRHTRVAGVADNLSGLAWDTAGERLLAVVNRPTLLLVLDRDGAVRRRIALRGFTDTEGVAVLADGRVAVTEEALNQIAVFRMPPASTDVVEHASASLLRLDLFPHGNAGYEGLAYDARGNCLWMVKEHRPEGLYRVCLEGADRLSIEDRSAWLPALDAGTDLSGVEVDPTTGHLWLLSDESKRITEVGRDGRRIAQRRLGGPGEPIPPQPEGIALDGQGHLYVVSEPDHFYRFGRD